MKKKLSPNTLVARDDNIPYELTKNIDNLIESEEVLFKYIRFDNLEALAFRNDWKGHYDQLLIFPDPLIHYRSDFVSLNPNKKEQFFNIDLFTSKEIRVYRHYCTLSEVPSFLERLKGMRTKKEDAYQYSFDISNQCEKRIFEDSKVIPIYSGNLDYIKIKELFFADKK
ncbi:MAG: hypothetical protein U9R34_08100 [Nanoarchaeota archaeon]|nr:hypothetical protein [Nanoarchaeota archaeon]